MMSVTPSEVGTSSSLAPEVKRKSKRKARPGDANKKKYNPKWESEELLKPWVMPSSSDTSKAVCRFCKTIVRAHKSDLLEHTNTSKHRKNYMNTLSPEESQKFVDALTEQFKKRKGGSDITNSSITSRSSSTFQIKIEATPITAERVVTPLNTSVNSVAPSAPTIDVAPVLSPVAATTLQSLPVNAMMPECNPFNEIYSVSHPRDEFWPQEGDEYNLSTKSPGDLVSVILEEPRLGNSNCVPTTTADIATLDDPSTFPPGLNNLLLTAISSFPSMNYALVDGVPLAPCKADSFRSEAFTAQPEDSTISLVNLTSNNDTISDEPMMTSIILEPEAATSLLLTSKQIIDSIEQGSYTTSELCTISLSALNQIKKIEAAATNSTHSMSIPIIGSNPYI